ncbi:MAG: hypothetical protein PHP52_05760 [Bacteroidales bacterium]|jgi:hypothetical protein|nr:hypothetical protein [Bacteroidales bacterium]MDD4215922.1 hypothetical protein [Bacteroidales bacterium]MDY0141181.1 hypothetical protein [Bacteroidales bacterium]
MEFSIIQIIGYVSSIIIAISMTLNSIVKFRWVNLVGATIMAGYGFVFGAIPVGILNSFIMAADIYYLVKIYSKNEKFETLEIRSDNRYLLRFLSFHNKEIQFFFPEFNYKPEVNTISFFVLRDMLVTGIFLAHKIDVNTLCVGLDYVIPEYRDFKNGKYIYKRIINKFIESGITKIITDGNSKQYITYLEKLGFNKNQKGMYEKKIA